MKVLTDYVNGVVHYAPIYRGQGAYIAHRCERARIQVAFRNGNIVLDSRRLRPTFEKIVGESVELRESVIARFGVPSINSAHKLFLYGRIVLCVVIRDEDVTYVAQEQFANVVRQQFLCRLPVTMHYKVFSRQWEMRDALLTQGILI
jgi:hypothetical protein